jgi:hypothetical protein
MTGQRSSTSFGWRLAPPLGLACLAALAVLPRPAGRAAPIPAPAAWPKTGPADRARSASNLKQIALALHNYHDVYGAFPCPAVYGKGGTPLLSWRVAILPFVEQAGLYKQFRFEEPWDSAHNKKLLDKMPAVYGLPGAKGVAPHATYYRVFTGPNAAFPQPRVLRPGQVTFGLRLAQIVDGASNTLLVVEAGEAVPWTKPDELAYDPKKPLPKLGGLFPEGLHAALADGSVKFLDRKVEEKALRALITPAGGEVVDWRTIPLAKPPAGK